MWKTWINTNTNRVAHCGGGNAGCAKDGWARLTTRVVPEGGDSAAHYLIVAKLCSCIGVALVSRKWPEVYDLCHMFLHVARMAVGFLTCTTCKNV